MSEKTELQRFTVPMTPDLYEFLINLQRAETILTGKHVSRASIVRRAIARQYRYGEVRLSCSNGDS